MPIFPLFRYLDTVGDGSGIKNANGNYLLSPQTFKLICPDDKGFSLETLMININGASSFTLNGYGSISGGLFNGWTMQLYTNGVLTNMFDGMPIKTNGDLARLSPTMSHINYSGPGDSVSVPISIKQFGMPLYLNKGDYIQITLNDDFTTLSSHYFNVQGYST